MELGSDLLNESMEVLSKYDFLRETYPALASHEAEGNSTDAGIPCQ